MLNPRHLAERVIRRPLDTHKGDYGHVFVLAGSAQYTGAPCLVSQAAIRSGSGLVTLGVAKSLHQVFASKLTEVMVRAFPGTRDQSLRLIAQRDIIQFSRSVDVVALGPGISTNRETLRLARALVLKIDRPFVIDADGIASLNGHLGILKKSKHPIVLTPHPGEMARLTGKTVSEVERDRKNIAIHFAKEYNVVLVLKGYRTVVANANGNFFINETGNPGMASAGMGDCLTGIIAALIGQGLEPYEASVLGVHVHGLAGDIASKDRGVVGLIATDLIDRVPDAFKALA